MDVRDGDNTKKDENIKFVRKKHTVWLQFGWIGIRMQITQIRMLRQLVMATSRNATLRELNAVIIFQTPVKDQNYKINTWWADL